MSNLEESPAYCDIGEVVFETYTSHNEKQRTYVYFFETHLNYLSEVISETWHKMRHRTYVHSLQIHVYMSYIV